MIRLPSTEEQIRAALTTGLAPGADPCRWAYARDALSDTERVAVGDPDARWPERMPVHAIIASLRHEVDTLRDVLARERRAHVTLRDENDRLRAAAQTLVDLGTGPLGQLAMDLHTPCTTGA